ncbi:MAG: cohesin domain-containing protein [Candidatus Poribacteria bacterium]|nr:cohesin domain-containing protein [Candidatus Poribacteria bacterium]
MKFSRYFSFVCILAIACIFTVGCEKMQKPVMDAITDTETETPAEMDDTLQPVDHPEDDSDGETPAEMDDTLQPVDHPEDNIQQPETPPEMDGPQRPPEEDTQQPEMPAEMEPDATITISPTEIALPEVGEQLTIKVNIDSKKPAVGYQFVLTFDATVLKYAEHSIPNYIPGSEDYTLEYSMLDDGNLQITVLSFTSTGIGEGALASATFEVLEKKASTIVLSDVTVDGPLLSVPGSDREIIINTLDLAISEDTVVIQ